MGNSDFFIDGSEDGLSVSKSSGNLVGVPDDTLVGTAVPCFEGVSVGTEDA